MATKRSSLRLTAAIILMALSLPVSITAAGLKTRLSEIGPGYSATSVNTAVFRSSPAVTFNNRQYVSYYDADGYLTIARRTTGTNNWEITRSQYKGNVADAHNVISMGIDGDGYLHVAFDHHGNPLHYCRSVAPESTILGPLTSMTGTLEDDVTYPEFYPLAGGDLLFVYRSGYSGKGNMVMNRYDTSAGRWQRVHDVLIDGEGERNAYWQLTTGDDGVIHLSWVWRETWLVETNHDLCYARSRDNGLTWERSDGIPYTLPITQATAEIAWNIPQGSELINQTSMTTDAAGHPMIATYWRDAADSIPQYRLVEHDGNRWLMSTVTCRTTPFSLSGGGTKMIPIARPRMVAGDKSDVYYIFRDAERGSKASIAHRDNRGGWTITDVTDFSVDAWEPTLDMTQWKENRRLHIYVQSTSQGDGEKVTATAPQPVYILEVTPAQ